MSSLPRRKPNSTREFGPISLEHAGQLGTSASYQSVPRSTQSPAPSSGQTVHLVLRDADLQIAHLAHGTRIFADAHLLTGRGSRGWLACSTGRSLRGSLACSRDADLRGWLIRSRDADLRGLLTCAHGTRISADCSPAQRDANLRGLPILHTGRGFPRITSHRSRDADLRGLPTSSRDMDLRGWLSADVDGRSDSASRSSASACRIRTNRLDCSRIWPFSRWLWICLCSRHDGRT